jgi:multisubunit Na+/H+ antiporter MnhC subunit
MWGLRQCSVVNDMTDVLNVIMAVSAGVILYLAYSHKKNNVNRFLYLVPTALIITALVITYYDFT